MKENVAIIGCGTVGTALAKLLGRAGYPIVGISTTDAERAHQMAQQIGVSRSSSAPWEVTRKAGLVFITTPDDIIQTTCETLASKNAFDPGTVVIHCSGSHPSTILESAQRCNALTLSIHPLQTFASPEQAEALVPGSYFGVEGEPEAMPVARRLVEDLEGIYLEISPAVKPLYHAAAVTVSNYLVVLVHMSMEFDRAAGISSQTAYQALRPLIDGTLRNIETQGVPGALTGPIARGDLVTVADHVKSIEEYAPQFLSMYTTLARHAIELALDKGTISEQTATRLRTVLASQ
jgi:predicted short-subunit dehydrogenase-like oxidoreductase (DUF2520 family)